MSCLVLNFHHYTTHSAVAEASNATTSPRRRRCWWWWWWWWWCLQRKFLKIKNCLSAVTTLPSPSSLPHTYSFHGGVSMRGEHGREGAGCDDGTSALHSSAGCGGRRCCGNVLRELASFVWDHPTQLQLQVSINTKRQQANRTFITNAPANYCSSWPVTIDHCISQHMEILQLHFN